MENDDGASRVLMDMIDEAEQLREIARRAKEKVSLSTSEHAYEQVSIKEIIGRFKQKSEIKQESEAHINNLLKMLEHDDYTKLFEFFDVTNSAYRIEYPKSGLQSASHEFLNPIHLPSKCEQRQPHGPFCDGLPPKAHRVAKEISKREIVYSRTSQGNSASGKPGVNWGLQFDSEFECGNLLRAEHVHRRNAPLQSADEYNLFLQEDPIDVSASNSPSSQWFFFRVQNTRRRHYRFNICNMTKSNSSFVNGMKPVLISERAFSERNEGWRRIGEEVCFFPTPQSILTSKDSHKYYTLSFTLNFEFAKDTVFIAFAPPYTYTQLQNTIYGLLKDPVANQYVRCGTFCRTPNGNRCDVLVIKDYRWKAVNALVGNGDDSTAGGEKKKRSKYDSATNTEDDIDIADIINAEFAKIDELYFDQDEGGDDTTEKQSSQDDYIPDVIRRVHDELMREKREKQDKLKKERIRELTEQRTRERRKQRRSRQSPVVVIVARMHASETVSSWVCEGIIRFLVSEHPVAQSLRKMANFVILPMLNPDGVVNGHYRSDGQGNDLNRVWKFPDIDQHTVIHRLKAFLTAIKVDDPEAFSNYMMSGANQNNKPLIFDNSRILAFIDLHGHSHKDGAFFYANKYGNALTVPEIMQALSQRETSVLEMKLRGKQLEEERLRQMEISRIEALTSQSEDVNKQQTSKFDIVDSLLSWQGGSNSDASNNKTDANASILSKQPGNHEKSDTKSEHNETRTVTHEVDPRLLIYSVAKHTKLVTLENCSLQSLSNDSNAAASHLDPARVVVSQELQVPLSVTLNASFFSGTIGEYSRRHLTTFDFLRLGKNLCLGLSDTFGLEIAYYSTGTNNPNEVNNTTHYDMVSMEHLVDLEEGSIGDPLDFDRSFDTLGAIELMWNESSDAASDDENDDGSGNNNNNNGKNSISSNPLIANSPIINHFNNLKNNNALNNRPLPNRGPLKTLPVQINVKYQYPSNASFQICGKGVDNNPLVSGYSQMESDLESSNKNNNNNIARDGNSDNNNNNNSNNVSQGDHNESNQPLVGGVPGIQAGTSKMPMEFGYIREGLISVQLTRRPGSRSLLGKQLGKPRSTVTFTMKVDDKAVTGPASANSSNAQHGSVGTRGGSDNIHEYADKIETIRVESRQQSKQQPQHQVHFPMPQVKVFESSQSNEVSGDHQSYQEVVDKPRPRLDTLDDSVFNESTITQKHREDEQPTVYEPQDVHHDEDMEPYHYHTNYDDVDVSDGHQESSASMVSASIAPMDPHLRQVSWDTLETPQVDVAGVTRVTESLKNTPNHRKSTDRPGSQQLQTMKNYIAELKQTARRQHDRIRDTVQVEFAKDVDYAFVINCLMNRKHKQLRSQVVEIHHRSQKYWNSVNGQNNDNNNNNNNGNDNIDGQQADLSLRGQSAKKRTTSASRTATSALVSAATSADDKERIEFLRQCQQGLLSRSFPKRRYLVNKAIAHNHNIPFQQPQAAAKIVTGKVIHESDMLWAGEDKVMLKYQIDQCFRRKDDIDASKVYDYAKSIVQQTLLQQDESNSNNNNTNNTVKSKVTERTVSPPRSKSPNKGNNTIADHNELQYQYHGETSQTAAMLSDSQSNMFGSIAITSLNNATNSIALLNEYANNERLTSPNSRGANHNIGIIIDSNSATNTGLVSMEGVPYDLQVNTSNDVTVSANDLNRSVRTPKSPKTPKSPLMLSDVLLMSDSPLPGGSPTTNINKKELVPSKVDLRFSESPLEEESSRLYQVNNIYYENSASSERRLISSLMKDERDSQQEFVGDFDWVVETPLLVEESRNNTIPTTSDTTTTTTIVETTEVNNSVPSSSVHKIRVGKRTTTTTTTTKDPRSSLDLIDGSDGVATEQLEKQPSKHAIDNPNQQSSIYQPEPQGIQSEDSGVNSSIISQNSVLTNQQPNSEDSENIKQNIRATRPNAEKPSSSMKSVRNQIHGLKSSAVSGSIPSKVASDPNTNNTNTKSLWGTLLGEEPAISEGTQRGNETEFDISRTIVDHEMNNDELVVNQSLQQPSRRGSKPGVSSNPDQHIPKILMSELMFRKQPPTRKGIPKL